MRVEGIHILSCKSLEERQQEWESQRKEKIRVMQNRAKNYLPGCTFEPNMQFAKYKPPEMLPDDDDPVTDFVSRLQKARDQKEQKQRELTEMGL